MHKLNIAVIDDGIQLDILQLLTGLATEVKCLQVLEGDCVAQYTHPIATVNHGTLCMALLIEYLERGACLDSVDISSLSIVNLEQAQTLTALAVALHWCDDHRIDLVLMSIGVKSFVYGRSLLPVVEHARTHLTIVAAAANDDVITYPACWGGVIGVKYTPDIKAVSDTICVQEAPRDGIEIEAWVAVGGVSASVAVRKKATGYFLCAWARETENAVTAGCGAA